MKKKQIAFCRLILLILLGVSVYFLGKRFSEKNQVDTNNAVLDKTVETNLPLDKKSQHDNVQDNTKEGVEKLKVKEEVEEKVVEAKKINIEDINIRNDDFFEKKDSKK